MKQIRVEHKANFTTVSNTFIRDKRLSLKAKGLLLTVLSLNDKEWDFSVAGLCAICKESKSAIYSAIDELIENLYCTRNQGQSKEGRFTQTIYTFYEEPYAENQYAVNLNTENQPQLNNNIINDLNNQETNNSFSFSERRKSASGKYDYVDASLFDVWSEWVRYAIQQHGAKDAMLRSQYDTLVEYTNGDVNLARQITKKAIDNGYKMFIAPKVTGTKKREETIWQ